MNSGVLEHDDDRHDGQRHCRDRDDSRTGAPLTPVWDSVGHVTHLAPYAAVEGFAGPPDRAN
jgi:hypothetical protein